jgi:hypothetical protein
MSDYTSKTPIYQEDYCDRCEKITLWRNSGDDLYRDVDLVCIRCVNGPIEQGGPV